MHPKVGRDVLKFETTDHPVKFFYSGKKEFAEKVMEILEKAEKPLNINEIRHLAGISWVATKSLVMDLVLGGRVEAFKSGRLFLFRVKKTVKFTES